VHGGRRETSGPGPPTFSNRSSRQEGFTPSGRKRPSPRGAKVTLMLPGPVLLRPPQGREHGSRCAPPVRRRKLFFEIGAGLFESCESAHIRSGFFLIRRWPDKRFKKTAHALTWNSTRNNRSIWPSRPENGRPVADWLLPRKPKIWSARPARSWKPRLRLIVGQLVSGTAGSHADDNEGSLVPLFPRGAIPVSAPRFPAETIRRRIFRRGDSNYAWSLHAAHETLKTARPPLTCYQKFRKFTTRLPGGACNASWSRRGAPSDITGFPRLKSRRLAVPPSPNPAIFRFCRWLPEADYPWRRLAPDIGECHAAGAPTIKARHKNVFGPAMSMPVCSPLPWGEAGGPRGHARSPLRRAAPGPNCLTQIDRGQRAKREGIPIPAQDVPTSATSR